MKLPALTALCLKEIDHYRRGELYTDTYGIEDQIAEGKKAVTCWTSRGTNTGSLFGKSATITGITIDRMTDGKIVESWDELDQLGMLQQLGFIPPQG
jgi:predicted ester cyclase